MVSFFFSVDILFKKVIRQFFLHKLITNQNKTITFICRTKTDNSITSQITSLTLNFIKERFLTEYLQGIGLMNRKRSSNELINRRR